MENDIISYQNVVGNYNSITADTLTGTIISYQNVVGNYNGCIRCNV